MMWLLTLLSMAHGFILIDPSYRLSGPENVSVNIASGACRANGMSDDELRNAISDVIDRYWNTVSESRLKLKLGDESNVSINGSAAAGEILVGCSPLGPYGASGVTTPNSEMNGARIVLNGSTLVPGGYYYEGLVGTLAHEMGHALGLNHSADAASVMTYESHGWGASPKYLSEDDKLGVTYLYPRKAVLGGLLGGCTSIAKANGPVSTSGQWPAWLEFLVLIFAARGLDKLRRLLFIRPLD